MVRNIGRHQKRIAANHYAFKVARVEHLPQASLSIPQLLSVPAIDGVSRGLGITSENPTPIVLTGPTFQDSAILKHASGYWACPRLLTGPLTRRVFTGDRKRDFCLRPCIAGGLQSTDQRLDR